MKKRVALIAASIFTVIAVIAALILRDPSEIKLVKGVKPFYTIYVEGGPPGTFVQRSYSLHMSYDEAVRQVDKEIPPSWVRQKDYGLASFSSQRSESVVIRRERYVTGLVESKKWRLDAEYLDIDSGLLTVPAKVVGNVPDSEGWITVDTEHTLTRFEFFTTKIRHTIGNYHQPKSTPYQVVSQRPKSNAIIVHLPLDSDTASLASKDQEVSFCR